MAMAVARALMAAMVVAAVAELAMAVDYHVGEESGWALGVNYTKWAADKTFLPEDVIIFTFSREAHDVVEVNAADYAACSATNPIDSFQGAGKVFITLDGVGKRYFLCSRANHCAQGMKVEIDVVAASDSPSPNSSPSGSTPSLISAASRRSYAQTKAALVHGILAVATIGLVL